IREDKGLVVGIDRFHLSNRNGIRRRRIADPQNDRHRGAKPFRKTHHHETPCLTLLVLSSFKMKGADANPYTQSHRDCVSFFAKRKKPTWRNTQRHSTTSAYSSTNHPAELECSSSSRPKYQEAAPTIVKALVRSC